MVSSEKLVESAFEAFNYAINRYVRNGALSVQLCFPKNSVMV